MADYSLEETPTWAVSIVCLILILISVITEKVLHFLSKFIRKRDKKSVTGAFRNMKTEFMQFGFISLLLTVTEKPISKICVTTSVWSSFLPCRDYDLEEPTVISTPNGDNVDLYCESKGKVSLISRNGIMQLHIFIFVLAAFHILYCVLTMGLGLAKMKRWIAWEEETKTLDYQIAYDPRRFRLTRQTSFGHRHLKYWSDHPVFLWFACFIRQFKGSVNKSDYLVLRNGFINAHFAHGSDFNFQKFLNRAFDKDFEVVVRISLWIWILCLFYIFFTAYGFYDHYWTPFVPLVMVLVVGTKLEVIITKMCLESRKETVVVRGTMLVRPNKHLFWFGRPELLLHLIHFILFQNSFQLAYFTWIWYQFGLRSCFYQGTEDIVLRIIMGLFVQFLCGYVTLPLYALVIQLNDLLDGIKYKGNNLYRKDQKGLKHWQRLARKNLQIHQSNSSGSQHLPPENTENFILEDDSSHKPSLQELVSTHDEIHPEETLFRELPSKEEDDHNFNNENKITEIEEESSTNIHRGLVMETESVGGLMSTSTSTGHNGGELSFRTFTQEGGHENKMEVPEFYEKNDQV